MAPLQVVSELFGRYSTALRVIANLLKEKKSINFKKALETPWCGGSGTVWAQLKLTFLSIITSFIKHALKHVKAGHQRGKSPSCGRVGCKNTRERSGFEGFTVFLATDLR